MARKKKLTTKLYEVSHKLAKIASVINDAEIIVTRDKKRAVKKLKRKIAYKISNKIIKKI